MSLDTSRIKAICFDVDGTLRDTDDQYTAQFERYFRAFRFLLPQRDSHAFARKFVMWAEAPGNMLISIPDRFHFDHKITAIGDWLHSKGIGRKSHEYLMIDGVRPMLEVLKPHFKMCVVSARPKRGTMGFLEYFDLLPYFDFVVSAQTARRTKPWPDPILWAAEKMEVSPDDCLMVGDTTVDIRAGIAAGTQTVGVLCGFGEADELERSGANLILDCTPNIVDILQPG